jgi:hypothetical protein
MTLRLINEFRYKRPRLIEAGIRRALIHLVSLVISEEAANR